MKGEKEVGQDSVVRIKFALFMEKFYFDFTVGSYMNKARLSSELKQIRVSNQLILDRLMHYRANRRLPKCPVIHSVTSLGVKLLAPGRYLSKYKPV